MKGYDTGNEGLERRDVGVQTLKKDLTLPCDDKSELVDLDQVKFSISKNFDEYCSPSTALLT